MLQTRKTQTKTTMPSTTNATTTGNTFPTTVNGPKDLKEYITKIHELMTQVRTEVDHVMTQPIARAEIPTTFLGSRDFNCIMCEAAHASFVHSATVLSQQSELLKTEQSLKECLAQLENIRKLLVNNKQQKKTMIKKIKNTCKIAAQATDGGGDAEMVEIEHDETETVKSLKAIIEQVVKPNHRTVSKKLLEQAHSILLAIRTRHIVLYKLAAENTIGEIIHHAEKCRAFFEQCRYNALIEFCTAAWWMETQKDPMDHSSYYVKVVFEGEPREFHPSNSSLRNPHDAAISPIRIDIQNATAPIEQSIVFSTYLDQELAETILTEEAVNAFQAGEAPSYYRGHNGTISSHPAAARGAVVRNEDETEEEEEQDEDDEDKSRIWGGCVAMAWS